MLTGARAGAALRYSGLVLLALAVSASSLTFNWIIEHHPEANLFPEFTGRVVYLSDILLFAGLVCWAIGWFLTPGRGMKYGPRYLFLTLLLLVTMTILSTVWAEDGTLAGFSATRRVLLLGLYLVMVNEVYRALSPTAIALFAVGFLHSGVALAQVFKGSSQAYGLGFNPNPVGLFLATASVLAYSLFLLNDVGWRVRALTLVGFLATLAGLAATSSRSALLGWLLGLLIVTLLAWLWKGTARRLIVKRAAAAALLLLLAGGLYAAVVPAAEHQQGREGAWLDLGAVRALGRFSLQEIANGLEGRGIDLGLALPIIREHPLLGVGAGNYPLALKQKLAPEAWGGIYTPPHNVLLLLLAELGILGAVGWVLVMAAPVIWFLSRRKSPPADLRRLFWLGPLVVLLFAGLWDFPPWATQDGRVLMMAVLGLWGGEAAAGSSSISQTTPSSGTDLPPKAV